MMGAGAVVLVVVVEVVGGGLTPDLAAGELHEASPRARRTAPTGTFHAGVTWHWPFTESRCMPYEPNNVVEPLGGVSPTCAHARMVGTRPLAVR
jgi:hypothetical protein